MSDFIKHFSEISQHNITEVGGKGANLAALTAAGCLVPPGFCITVHAYQTFLQDSGLDEHIASTIADIDWSVLENLQIFGTVIRELIMKNEIPDRIKEAILSAYWRLFTLPPVSGKLYVAVRSSATAEGVPDILFVGQHDTYLNIFGESDLLFSVKKCWASLWSDWAIAYRQKHNIDYTKVLMAVVVQQMIPSIVSGVLFTTNPVTDKPNEILINVN